MSQPLYFDRVQETSVTTGTGTYTLAGAVTGYQPFSVVGDGHQCEYMAAAVDSSGIPSGGWEVGIGTYTLAGTTLARTAILASSNAGAAVNWGAGTRRLSLVYSAASLVRSSSITLSNAQILAWPTTIYELVAAVPSLRIQPLWIDFHITIAAGGDYGTIDPDAFTDVALGVNPGLMSYLANDSTAVTTDLTTFLTGSPVQRRALIVPAIPIIASTVNYLGALLRGAEETNLALNVSLDNGGAGNFSGGNVANTLVITTLYTLIP